MNTSSHTAGRLQGKRALITAGASGLGLAIAQAFEREGAIVAICDLPGAALDSVEVTYPHWRVYRADVSNEPNVDDMFSDMDAEWESLDILVNNAGIAGPTCPVEDMSADDWRRTMDVNLLGSFLCARRAIPSMKRAKGGAIINLSSSAGRFGFALRSAYSASKWGVVGFTKSLSIEVGPEGITCNAILPGLVSGRRLDEVITARAHELGKSFEEQKTEMFGRVAMQSSVEASDVAATAVFLASKEARFITGETINVDAGLLSL